MKTRIALSLVTISLLWMPCVHSASFDCAKATTKIEKVICANPKLSELDEKLSALYKKVLELSPIPWRGGVRDDDPEAIKRRILWLSELAVGVACVDQISRVIEHTMMWHSAR